MACLNPLRTYFLVTCPRLDPNNGITARGFTWTSPEEKFVIFNVAGSLGKTIDNEQLPSSRNCFLRRLSQARTVLLVAGYSGTIFPRRNLLTRRRE